VRRGKVVIPGLVNHGPFGMRKIFFS